MPDMLVKLYELPDESEAIERCRARGVEIRRAMAPDKLRVVNWVRSHSGECAAGECDVSFSHCPIGCYLATRGSEIVGYACYDATAPNFFGPTRVLDSEQGNGIGTALLLRCLSAMREAGCGYAIIGSVGPVEFYQKVCGALVIPDSSPGIYKDFLRGIEKAENAQTH